MPIKQSDIPEFLARVDAMVQPYNATMDKFTDDDRMHLLELRQFHLGAVSAIEAKLGVKPTTAQCRKIARGKY